MKSATSPRHWILGSLLLGLSCAASAPLGSPIGEGAGPAAKALVQDPSAPPNEVSTVEVIIRDEGIEAPVEVMAGALTFSFSNGTRRERTAEIQGKDRHWKVEGPIPPERSMTLELLLEPGEYVLISGAGQTRLTAKLRVVKRPSPSLSPLLFWETPWSTDGQGLKASIPGSER